MEEKTVKVLEFPVYFLNKAERVPLEKAEWIRCVMNAFLEMQAYLNGVYLEDADNKRACQDEGTI